MTSWTKDDSGFAPGANLINCLKSHVDEVTKNASGFGRKSDAIDRVSATGKECCVLVVCKPHIFYS